MLSSIVRLKKNKKSPSTLKRNAKRREEFIKRKAETASNQESFDSDNEKDMESSQHFKCDQCDRNFKTDQGLKIHIGKSHKSEDEP